MFGYLLISAAVAACLFMLHMQGTSLASVSRLVEFLQLLYVVGLIDMDWPRAFSTRLFPFASVAAGNLDLGAVGCLSSSHDQLGAWVLGLLLPVGSVVGLLLTAALGYAVSVVIPWLWSLRGSSLRGAVASTELQAKQNVSVTGPLFSLAACNAAVGVACVTSVFAIRTSLEPLRCHDVDGLSVTVSDSAVMCADEARGVRWALSLLFTSVYGVLVPGLLAYLLRRNMVGIRTDLGGQSAGRRSSTPASNPYHFLHLRLSLLYDSLVPQWYFWRVLVVVHKGALVLAVSVLHQRPDDSARLALALLLLGLGLHGAVQPYLPTPMARSSRVPSLGQRWCVAACDGPAVCVCCGAGTRLARVAVVASRQDGSRLCVG